MSNATVAVVDIGSNSIKILVARAGARGLPETLLSHTIEARISAGINATTPGLSEMSMASGIDAITNLLKQAESFAPRSIQLVATSAVRDAANGTDFQTRVQAATGHDIRILSGDDEANLIGRGITCDPALWDLQDFYLFDLGGGSLEGLAFRQQTMHQAQSLQLGCVRLTERFVADRTQPAPSGELAAIVRHTTAELQNHNFVFDLPGGAISVGTGGTITTARAMLAARQDQTLEESNPQVSIANLKLLLDELAPLNLEQRKAIAGLSPARADVFPTALATLIAVANAGGFPAYHHSFYNLRYGVAAALLAD